MRTDDDVVVWCYLRYERLHGFCHLCGRLSHASQSCDGEDGKPPFSDLLCAAGRRLGKSIGDVPLGRGGFVNSSGSGGSASQPSPSVYGGESTLARPLGMSLAEVLADLSTPNSQPQSPWRSNVASSSSLAPSIPAQDRLQDLLEETPSDNAPTRSSGCSTGE